MRPGVARQLTAAEMRRVLAAEGIILLVPENTVVGFAYTHQGWAWHYARTNRARPGVVVIGPHRLAGRPVSLLVATTATR